MSGPAAEKEVENVSIQRLRRAILRVEQVVLRETAALRARQSVDMAELNRRKSEGLLALSRLGRAADKDALDGGTLALLHRLRAALDDNRAAIRLHLAAVEEISEVINGAMREAESDGTYSAPGPASNSC